MFPFGALAVRLWPKVAVCVCVIRSIPAAPVRSFAAGGFSEIIYAAAAAWKNLEFGPTRRQWERKIEEGRFLNRLKPRDGRKRFHGMGFAQEIIHLRECDMLKSINMQTLNSVA